MAEFWRRWHISLSSWFRDYLYIPLGGSKNGKSIFKKYFTIFLVSGLWHGANWTFIFWGLYHSILFIPSFIFGTNRKYTSSVVAESTFSKAQGILSGRENIFFGYNWMDFFRSENIKVL